MLGHKLHSFLWTLALLLLIWYLKTWLELSEQFRSVEGLLVDWWLAVGWT